MCVRACVCVCYMCFIRVLNYSSKPMVFQKNLSTVVEYLMPRTMSTLGKTHNREMVEEERNHRHTFLIDTVYSGIRKVVAV